jgi:hypothetical protein
MKELIQTRQAAIDNVAHWFNQDGKKVAEVIDQSIKDSGMSSTSQFWFYRSLKLNKNLSGKVFSDHAFAHLKSFLDLYAENHIPLENGRFIDYSLKDTLKTTGYAGFTSLYGSAPTWLSGITASTHIDIFAYPCFQGRYTRADFYKSVLVNYLINNQKFILENNYYVISSLIEKEYMIDLNEKAILRNNLISEGDGYLNYILSPSGIRSFLSKNPRVLNEAKSYFRENGFVLPNMPVLPIGFDYVISGNGFIDSVSTVRLWDQ